MLKLNVEKAPRKPRTKKLAAIAPNYTLALPDPCPFVTVPNRHAKIEAALTRLINPPAFTCGSTRTVAGVNYTVALCSDDSVRIATDGALVALGRFVVVTRRTDYGYSVESRIVDVTPAAAVSADIVESLAGDLTYFAMRAGRFSGVQS